MSNNVYKTHKTHNFLKSGYINNSSNFGDIFETDTNRISQRQKQINYGKNTVGYDNYITLVPKSLRHGYIEHPRTPNPYLKISKRGFDGIVKKWRRKLYDWDNKDNKSKQAQLFNNINNDDDDNDDDDNDDDNDVL